jgi:hypothetical protein
MERRDNSNHLMDPWLWLIGLIIVLLLTWGGIF